MQRILTSITVSIVAMVLATPVGALLIWTGATDGDVFNEANWLSGISTPPAGTIDPGYAVNALVQFPGLTPVADGSAGPLTLGSLGIMQVTGGTFTSTDVIRRDTTPNTNDGQNATVIISESPQTSGSVTALGIQELNVSLITSMTLTDTGNPIQYSVVSFAASLATNAVLNLPGESVADAVSEHLAKFLVGGGAPVIGTDPALIEPGDNLQIISDGASGSIVMPIADPLPVIPGDIDKDGDLDGVDLSEFFTNFTGPGNGPPLNPDTDLDADTDVDGVDLSLAFANFTGPRGPSVVAVPEPATLTLLALGGLLASRRRGRVG